MKNILLATDLSTAATGAAGYAAWLAGIVGARLTLMSAYRVAPVFAGSSNIETPEDSLPELLQCRLEEVAARFRAENHIAVNVLARSGDPVRAILAAAWDIHADLIVVGKAGVGRSNSVTFGATVGAVARKTTIPLLIVPQTAERILPATIALAKNLFNDELPTALKELLSRFGCRLYLLGVKARMPGETVEIYRADSIHSAGEFFHRLYEIPVDNKLRHSIENFIEVAPINWLAVRPVAGLAPERWVLGGRTKELAFDIRVPLLVLPEAGKPAGHSGRRSS
jgi:nucleotide-binding universal stress UspA family protein